MQESPLSSTNDNRSGFKTSDCVRRQGAIRFKSRCSERTRKYVSILKRIDEFPNIHKTRCEIPPKRRGNAAIGHKMGF